MPQPLVEYSDEEAGILDGAIFIFAYGTNPEILMLVECLKRQGSQPAWYCSFAPVTAALPGIDLEGKEVWRGKFGRDYGVTGAYEQYGHAAED